MPYTPSTAQSDHAIVDAVASLDLDLSADEIQALEVPYTPCEDLQALSGQAEIRRRMGLTRSLAETLQNA